MIPVAGIAASKGKETAQALKNDVYVRKWTSVEGKGKKAVAVEHEIHVNPTGILTGVAAGVVAAGAAVLGGALALRFSGKKLEMGEVKHYFMVDTFESTVIGYNTVEDSPAVAATPDETVTYDQYIWALQDLETLRIVRRYEYKVPTPYPPYEAGENEVWKYTTSTRTYTAPGSPAIPAVTHEEPVYGDYVAVVLTKRGVPFGVFRGDDAQAEAVRRALKRAPRAKDNSLTAVSSQVVTAINPITRKRQQSRRWNYYYIAPGLALEDKDGDKWWNPFD